MKNRKNHDNLCSHDRHDFPFLAFKSCPIRHKRIIKIMKIRELLSLHQDLKLSYRFSPAFSVILPLAFFKEAANKECPYPI